MVSERPDITEHHDILVRCPLVRRREIRMSAQAEIAAAITTADAVEPAANPIAAIWFD